MYSSINKPSFSPCVHIVTTNLWNDGDPFPDIVKTQERGVDIIDQEMTGDVTQSEESWYQWALPCPGSTYNANLIWNTYNIQSYCIELKKTKIKQIRNMIWANISIVTLKFVYSSDEISSIKMRWCHLNISRIGQWRLVQSESQIWGMWNLYLRPQHNRGDFPCS